jgi:hypothetical protein
VLTGASAVGPQGIKYGSMIRRYGTLRSQSEVVEDGC